MNPVNRIPKTVKFDEPELEAKYRKVKGAIKFRGSSVELLKKLRADLLKA